MISSHILSEISLLADDIGIIDHGALLEEESLAELEQKSSKHIRFTLSDTAPVSYTHLDVYKRQSMNMGAAMAPAAKEVIRQHFEDFGRSEKEYDRIITGEDVYKRQLIIRSMDTGHHPIMI